MSKPESLHFTDLVVATNKIFNQRPKSNPINRAWTRVHFVVPDSWEAPKAVAAWLNDNCTDLFAFYTYLNPKSKNSEYLMVVRFKNKDDAILFKLRGGHQAWEKV